MGEMLQMMKVLQMELLLDWHSSTNFGKIGRLRAPKLILSRKQSRNQLRKEKISVRNGLKDVQSKISLTIPDFGKTKRHNYYDDFIPAIYPIARRGKHQPCLVSTRFRRLLVKSRELGNIYENCTLVAKWRVGGRSWPNC